jgi:hypothetical protein
VLKGHLDEFLAVYDDRFASPRGPLRAMISGAVRKFLKCGILDYGFARIPRPECGDEFLLAHSCKSRCLCPSCQKKGQVEFGEWVAEELLEAVPHRHVVLSVPRRLRLPFRRDRSRLAKLARAAWETVKELLQVAAGEKDAVPDGVACIQTYGNLLDRHPHAHLLVSWGVFRPDGMFVPVTDVPPKQQSEKLFRLKILRMLKAEGAIDDAVIENLLSWPNTGFGAHAGLEIAATDAATRENVARDRLTPAREHPKPPAMKHVLHLVLMLSLAGACRAEDLDKPVNLLRKAEPGDVLVPAGLADDNPDTVATGPAPLEVVFGFADTVTPEQIVVQLPRATATAGRFDVPASTVSGDAEFVFLRGDVLRGDHLPQKFPIPATAAKWVMIRFTAVAGASKISVAGVALMGREGPPRSSYEFSESPAKALEMVAGLRGLGELKVEITPDESSLFEDAKDGRLDTWTFAEAALLASGVLEKARRAEYMAKIDALFDKAKTSTEAAKSPAEKGEVLLKWLDAGPMKKGYVTNQTDVSVILDAGTYNCVSSAALYNILGRRLGLDLRAIEVPDHAFAILYEGTTHADVETTTPAGFNPARDQRALREFEKKTGFT